MLSLIQIFECHKKDVSYRWVITKQKLIHTRITYAMLKHAPSLIVRIKFDFGMITKNEWWRLTISPPIHIYIFIYVFGQNIRRVKRYISSGYRKSLKCGDWVWDNIACGQNYCLLTNGHPSMAMGLWWICPQGWFYVCAQLMNDVVTK